MESVHHEIAKQVQAGHALIFPLSAIRGLTNLWLSPMYFIPQVGQLPHLIFDFTWISLNKYTAQTPPEEVMRFGGTLHHIIRQVLKAYPRLGLVYLGKVDLTKTYMRLWVPIEDTPSVDFLILKKRSNI